MKTRSRLRHRMWLGVLPALSVLAIGFSALATIPTTLLDFFHPGTQPNSLNAEIIPSTTCAFCHGYYDENQEPYTRWSASVMAQSARDPVFYACLAVANLDAAQVGDICIRCHAPVAWLEGRSTPTNGSAFIQKDRDGVTCHVCHRMVDPVYDPQNNPPEDAQILANLDPAPPALPHSGQYVIDPDD